MDTPTTDSLDATQVADFLEKNPDFFDTHQDLLSNLLLPPANAGATSLLERQASVLRERNTELRHRMTALIENARLNDTLFNLTKDLGLALLESRTVNDLSKALHHSIYKEFKLDCGSLLLFGGPDVKNRAFITQTTREGAQKVLGSLLKGERIQCCALRETEFHYLFPLASEHTGSAAIIPLYYKRELGILALGSYDSSHFETNMDTLFISYIGQIVSRRLYEIIDRNEDL